MKKGSKKSKNKRINIEELPINEIIYGNCRRIIKRFPDSCIDSIITDPPYGLGFMSKKWDTFKPDYINKQFKNRGHKNPKRQGRSMYAGEYNFSLEANTEFQKWFTRWAKECLRIAKPGAFMLVFGGTRTFHRLTCAIEDAGWQIRDSISYFSNVDTKIQIFYNSLNNEQKGVFQELFSSGEVLSWMYGSGFPKSKDIGKELDKQECRKRLTKKLGRKPTKKEFERVWKKFRKVISITERKGNPINTQGKKGCINRRPWMERQIKEYGNLVDIETAPVTKLAKLWDGYGTGLKPSWEPIIIAMKPVDGNFAKNAEKWGVAGLNIDGGRIGICPGWSYPKGAGGNTFHGQKRLTDPEISIQGRWPANLILDSESAKLLDLQSGECKPPWGKESESRKDTSWFSGKTNSYGKLYRDTGGASRFFKVLKKENICTLCNSTTDKDSNIIKGKKGDLLCNVKNAIKNSNRKGRGNYSATKAVLRKKQHNKKGKSAKSNISVSNAKKHLSNMQATNESSVQKNVKVKIVKKLALNVISAGGLCKRCGIAIAQSLVAIKQDHSQELTHILDYMPDYKKCILIQNLVSFVELWENIDTIPTTKSLLILFGSVNLAIINYIPETKKSESTRFRYIAKASSPERNAGCEGLEKKTWTDGRKGKADFPKQRDIAKRTNFHPTVKPLQLMQYLCMLLKMPNKNQIILDPFVGSGTTCIACKEFGINYIGIEKDKGYCEIARARLKNVRPNLFKSLPKKKSKKKVKESFGLV